MCNKAFLKINAFFHLNGFNPPAYFQRHITCGGASIQRPVKCTFSERPVCNRSKRKSNVLIWSIIFNI